MKALRFGTTHHPSSTKDCLPYAKSGVSLRAWRWEWGVAFLGAGSGETWFSRGAVLTSRDCTSHLNH